MAEVTDGGGWAGRRVFLTGDSGFKGSWLALWLADLGAVVTGFSLPAPTDPSLFGQARVGEVIRHVDGDVRDLAAVERAMVEARPEIVFHLAAQPLVRLSYAEPVETFATNVMGTVNVLEACRRVPGVRAAICITTDKCYENREWVWPYRENDPMGGHDPYSASKGAAEIAISAYRRSFFEGVDGAALIASVRAGNVIGGGDYAADRLVPDIVRALEGGTRPSIRAPGSVRPWQHVLEALGGYLMIADRLLAGDAAVATAWNFGPADDDAKPVGWIVPRMLAAWGRPGDAWDRPDGPQPHEATLLKLDCAKARNELGWRPAMGLADALTLVADWHRSVRDGGDPRTISLQHIHSYRRALASRLQEVTTWQQR